MQGKMHRTTNNRKNCRFKGAEASAESADPGLGETYLRGIPMGRIGDSNDIKGVAIFLASDASAWITGALVPLDGGNLAKNAGGTHPGQPGAPTEQVGLS